MRFLLRLELKDECKYLIQQMKKDGIIPSTNLSSIYYKFLTTKDQVIAEHVEQDILKQQIECELLIFFLF